MNPIEQICKERAQNCVTEAESAGRNAKALAIQLATIGVFCIGVIFAPTWEKNLALPF